MCANPFLTPNHGQFPTPNAGPACCQARRELEETRSELDRVSALLYLLERQIEEAGLFAAGSVTTIAADELLSLIRARVKVLAAGDLPE